MSHIKTPSHLRTARAVVYTMLVGLVAWSIFTSCDRSQTPPYRITALSNIMSSHWDIETHIIDIADYTKGAGESYDALFLIIEDESRNIPPDLLHDILKLRNKEVIWAGHHSDTLVSSLIGRDVQELAHPDRFTSLQYKNVSFPLKDLDILEYNQWPLGINVTVLASLLDKSNDSSPFIIDIHDRYLILPFQTEFYYFADSPSVVFLDVLHAAFGHHPREKKALMRLEDVSPYSYRDTEELREIYDYLRDAHIPVHVALIARHIDNAQGIDMEIGDSSDFRKLLHEMQDGGLVTFLQHGYTHQRGDQVSGDGYEFWDDKYHAPVTNDSPAYVMNRINRAQDVMRKNGLTVPDIWETPHYALSDLDNTIVNSVYRFRYEHIPNIGSLPFAAQIGPTIYFPENLGYVADGRGDLMRMEDRLARLSVFEDPVASFFWHPYRDFEELDVLVKMIAEKGYRFISVYDLVEQDDLQGGVRRPVKKAQGPIKKVLMITSL